MEIDKKWIQLVKKYMFDLYIPTEKKLKKGKLKSMPYTIYEISDMLSAVYYEAISYRQFRDCYLARVKEFTKPHS